MKSEEFDLIGKTIFKSLLDLYKVIHTFTPNKYDRVDVYFGKSVGEIKYRTRQFSTYIIEEPKFSVLKAVPLVNQYYIVVHLNDIYFWRTQTIQKYPIVHLSFLIDNEHKDNLIEKQVRYLPVSDCDFIFHRMTPSSLWELIKFC